jgi:signal peptidase II
VDRVVKGRWLSGSVTDFIDFSFWPNFNVADSAITIGVVVLLWAANRSR